MAGNMCEWTASLYQKEGPNISSNGILLDDGFYLGDSDTYYVYKGGGWSTLARHARISDRPSAFANGVGGNLSFRVIYSI